MVKAFDVEIAIKMYLHFLILSHKVNATVNSNAFQSIRDQLSEIELGAG